MRAQRILWISALSLLALLSVRACSEEIKRSQFPKDFVFGVSTAAAQIEGATTTDGRGPSVWDQFIKQRPECMEDGSTNTVAIDSYNRYKEDVLAIKNIGVDVYRFSISWTRILPQGSVSGGVNQAGIDHYNRLIDELVAQGIKPFVTLLHFDWPAVLERNNGGFLNRSIVDDFKNYAEICFKTYGDRVKNWITINEPLITAKYGYDFGGNPPGRCSDRKTCATGNSATEPYIASHNLLLAHATAARLYKEKFQQTQGGQIGLSLVGQNYLPFSNITADQEAADRAMDFELGWFMEPLVFGDYPPIMRQIVKERLPVFTQEDSNLVKGSFDFIGINYYTTRYASALPIDINATPIRFAADQFIKETTVNVQGVPIGPNPGSAFIFVYPPGLNDILMKIKNRYQNPKIYITENGTVDRKNDSIPMEKVLNDQHRIDFISQHLQQLVLAIQNGADVKGYIHWSAFDDFEWNEGYMVRYGLYYTDFKNNLTRTPKQSLKWYNGFLKDGNQA